MLLVAFLGCLDIFGRFTVSNSKTFVINTYLCMKFSRYIVMNLTVLSVIQDQKLSELGSLVNTSVYKHLFR